MVLASFLFSIMGLLAKVALRQVPSAEAVFFRSFLALLVVLALQAARARRLRSLLGTQRSLLLLRGALGSGGLLAFFYTMGHLQLGEAVLLVQCSAVFVTLFAAWFLHERLELARLSLLALALVGVVLVVQPGSQTLSPAALVGLLGAALAGGAYVTVRRLTQSEDNATILAYFLALSSVSAVPVALWQGAVLPGPVEFAALIGCGVLAAAAQLLMNQAYRLEKAGAVSASGTVGVLFAAGWGYAFWGEVPSGLKALGGGIILVAVAALAFVRAAGPARAAAAPEDER